MSTKYCYWQLLLSKVIILHNNVKYKLRLFIALPFILVFTIEKKNSIYKGSQCRVSLKSRKINDCNIQFNDFRFIINTKEEVQKALTMVIITKKKLHVWVFLSLLPILNFILLVKCFRETFQKLTFILSEPSKTLFSACGFSTG